MMIENLTKEQIAGVATAWRVLLNDLKADFDSLSVLIELFCWWIACNEDVKLESSTDYFQQALIAEIGENECERITRRSGRHFHFGRGQFADG
jgi:hypothetical protein